MSDVGFFLLWAVLTLGAAWLVNGLVALLSGEHPGDTGSVWLDMMLGELRGLLEGLSLIGRRWVLWTVAVVLGALAFAVLHFVLHAKPNT
jgi:hypothetical protein